MLKDSLAIRQTDQKDAKFLLLATGVQSAKANCQEEIPFKFLGTYLITKKCFETTENTACYEVTVSFDSDKSNILNGKKKGIFDVLLADASENKHALCENQSIGNTLCFIHSSKLHLSKRNDKILVRMKAKAPKSE